MAADPPLGASHEVSAYRKRLQRRKALLREAGSTASLPALGGGSGGTRRQKHRWSLLFIVCVALIFLALGRNVPEAQDLLTRPLAQGVRHWGTLQVRHRAGDGLLTPPSSGLGREPEPEPPQVCLMVSEYWGLPTAGGTATAFELRRQSCLPFACAPRASGARLGNTQEAPLTPHTHTSTCMPQCTCAAQQQPHWHACTGNLRQLWRLRQS